MKINKQNSFEIIKWEKKLVIEKKKITLIMNQDEKQRLFV